MAAGNVALSTQGFVFSAGSVGQTATVERFWGVERERKKGWLILDSASEGDSLFGLVWIVSNHLQSRKDQRPVRKKVDHSSGSGSDVIDWFLHLLEQHNSWLFGGCSQCRQMLYFHHCKAFSEEPAGQTQYCLLKSKWGPQVIFLNELNIWTIKNNTKEKKTGWSSPIEAVSTENR